jgi:hypothetical protein
MLETIRRLLGISMLLALAAAPGPAGARGVWHGYIMRGQIVDVDGGAVTLCVGRADGAKPGQVLSVVRYTRMAGVSHGAPRILRRDAVGAVRIEAVLDDHFAEATVMSGSAARQDMVELSRK